MASSEATVLSQLTEEKIWACAHCKTHLAYNKDICSKKFQGKHGKAFLFNEAINLSIKPQQERHLMTGKHVISAVHCASCDEYLGWKYIQAPNIEQEYKVGKLLIEKSRISEAGEWS